MDNFFVITGAPGTGKTTLLKEIERQGYTVVAEPARYVLKEQRSVGGKGVPEKDPALFVSLMLAREVEWFKECERSRQSIVFFDRGVVDNIGYARLFGIGESDINKMAKLCRYNNNVFYLPMWKDIYVTDDERKMTYEVAKDFGIELRKGYEEFGYRLVDVPYDTPKGRCDFILEKIKAL